MYLLTCPSLIALMLGLHDESHNLTNQYLLPLLLAEEQCIPSPVLLLIEMDPACDIYTTD